MKQELLKNILKNEQPKKHTRNGTLVKKIKLPTSTTYI